MNQLSPQKIITKIYWINGSTRMYILLMFSQGRFRCIYIYS